jgi:YD repeat-containing protein
MAVQETETWAQKDAPATATAVFPPDEPQGWPASDYRRASVYYFDSVGRRVNVLSPGGGIETTQYDSYDNVERTLTAGNRQRALEAGTESPARSLLLDTQSKHSADGTRLESSLGPLHEVTLANGKVVQARAHTQYTYDERTPGNEVHPAWVSGGWRNAEVPHRLLTSTTEGAQVQGGGEEDVRTIKDSYSGQEGLGWKLHKPTSVTTEPQPGKTSTRTTVYDPNTGDVIEATKPAGNVKSPPPIYTNSFGTTGTKAGQFNHPGDVAVDAKGNLWVLDRGNSRIEELNAKGKYVRAFGTAGAGNGQLSTPDGVALDSHGNVWVADHGNNRLVEFNEKGEFQKNVGVSGTGNGQLSGPEGVAVDAHNNLWVSDTGNGRVEVFSETGEWLKTVGAKGSGAGQIGEPEGLTLDSAGNVWVADWSNYRVEEFNEKGEYVTQFGTAGSAPGQINHPYGIGVDASGNVWVGDTGNNRVDEFNAKGEYETQFGSTGSGAAQFSFSWPIGIAVAGNGNLFVTDSNNNRIEEWRQYILGAQTTRTAYYSAGTESSVAACQNHPEWAGLPCQSGPAKQPEGSLGKLPVTTTTYNIFDQPQTVTSTAGSSTRTKTTTYDAAGRAIENATTSTVGKALPAVRGEYDPKTGLEVKQSTTTGTTTKSITSHYNSLGQLTSYTDAAGNTSTTSYDIDGRVVEASDGRGTQTYSYDSTTGQLTGVKDSAAGNFGGTYNAEGQLVTETYPNGMTATNSYNSLGQTISVAYAKGSSTWYSDAVAISIHGQWMSQASTLQSDSYSYDNIGRMTEVQETPQGKGCAATLYTYDENSNRTSQTKRESGEAKCATSGGATEGHIYDEADRLADPGVQNEPFGANTVLPASDAGGHALETSYYADGSIYTQSQETPTNTYALDPSGRHLETTSQIGLETAKTTTSHYAGSGPTPAWTEEGTNFTRNIGGIKGTLAAVQKNGEVVLQLSNLHGDVIGTVADTAEAAPKLTSEPTAFGVPTSGTAAPFSWLGSGGLSTELPSGVASNGSEVYVPQLGVNLEPEGLSGAAAQDPVNEYLANQTLAQPTGNETMTLPGAIEPAPVNTQMQEEFYKNPPWNKPPAGAQPHDPSILLTPGQAFAVAAVFRQGGNIAEALSKLNIPALASLIIKALAQLSQPILEGLAYGLEICYEAIHATGSGNSGRCKLWVNLVFGFPPVEVGDGICWAKTYKRKNKIHYTYPYCQTNYSWP